MAQVNHLTNYKSSHFQEGGVLKVVCHNTVVVSADQERITLDNGGWRTKKTRDDMNRAANQFDLGYQVFQKDFDWFVRIEHNGAILPFDGRTLTLERGTENA